MELTRTFTKLIGLGEGQNKGCDCRKTRSCKKYNQSLNEVAKDNLRVVRFDIVDFGVLLQ